MYDGDARDMYAHAPAPEMMPNLAIDDAYFEWYKEKTGKTLNRRFVLPVLNLLQGHPESGKMWMESIDRILIKELGFATTIIQLLKIATSTSRRSKDVSSCYYARWTIFVFLILMNRMQRISTI